MAPALRQEGAGCSRALRPMAEGRASASSPLLPGSVGTGGCQCGGLWGDEVGRFRMAGAECLQSHRPGFKALLPTCGLRDFRSDVSLLDSKDEARVWFS